MADVGSFLEEEHMAIFEGAGVAIVTPFKENGEISFDKLDELIEEQIAGHTDCIVSMGTTGESATTTEEEHLEVIRFTCERVKGRIPVIAEPAPTAQRRRSPFLRKRKEREPTACFWCPRIIIRPPRMD